MTTDRDLPTPTPEPGVLAECNLPAAGPVAKPSSIVLACGDANASLAHLIWSSWTPTTAGAISDYVHNTCTPNFAQGTFVSTPATVRLGYPLETIAGEEFAMLTYTYADPSAPGGSATHTEVAATNPG